MNYLTHGQGGHLSITALWCFMSARFFPSSLIKLRTCTNIAVHVRMRIHSLAGPRAGRTIV